NWLKFVEAIGTPELAEDPRFETSNKRMENLKALEDTLTDILGKDTTAAWLEKLEAAGVPAGPVYDVKEMSEDPHTAARAMIDHVPAATGGEHAVIAHPVKYSATPAAVRRGAPLMGEHSREVLVEFGFSSQEIDGLIASGAIIEPDVTAKAAE
ncbi:MAG: CoA transferase, partial [Alphaproteobacteria bacterium]